MIALLMHWYYCDHCYHQSIMFFNQFVVLFREHNGRLWMYLTQWGSPTLSWGSSRGGTVLIDGSNMWGCFWQSSSCISSGSGPADFTFPLYIVQKTFVFWICCHGKKANGTTFDMKSFDIEQMTKRNLPLQTCIERAVVDSYNLWRVLYGCLIRIRNSVL